MRRPVRTRLSLMARIDRHILIGRDAMQRGEWEAARTQITAALSLTHSEARLAETKNNLEILLDRCDRKIAEQQGLRGGSRTLRQFPEVL